MMKEFEDLRNTLQEKESELKEAKIELQAFHKTLSSQNQSDEAHGLGLELQLSERTQDKNALEIHNQQLQEELNQATAMLKKQTEEMEHYSEHNQSLKKEVVTLKKKIEALEFSQVSKSTGQELLEGYLEADFGRGMSATNIGNYDMSKFIEKEPEVSHKEVPEVTHREIPEVNKISLDDRESQTESQIVADQQIQVALLEEAPKQSSEEIEVILSIEITKAIEFVPEKPEDNPLHLKKKESVAPKVKKVKKTKPAFDKSTISNIKNIASGAQNKGTFRINATKEEKESKLKEILEEKRKNQRTTAQSNISGNMELPDSLQRRIVKIEGSFYDYLNIQSDSKLVKFIEKEIGKPVNSEMYSDYVTRVGSNMKRKLRIMVLFGKNFI